jgi:hypothetical protein
VPGSATGIGTRPGAVRQPAGGAGRCGSVLTGARARETARCAGVARSPEQLVGKQKVGGSFPSAGKSARQTPIAPGPVATSAASVGSANVGPGN